MKQAMEINQTPDCSLPHPRRLYWQAAEGGLSEYLSSYFVLLGRGHLYQLIPLRDEHMDPLMEVSMLTLLVLYSCP